MDRHDENLKKWLSTATHPLLGEKIGELWSINKKVMGVNVNPPNISH